MKLYEQKASGYTREVEEGFNILAFLFGPFWYLVKGMIGMAILGFFGILILSLLLNWIGTIIGWILIGATANRSYEDYLIRKGYTILNKKKKEKFTWECDFCNEKFKTKKEAVEHERKCKENKK